MRAAKSRSQSRTRFNDVGALVYYLRAVPWTGPGFSVAKYKDELIALQAQVGLRIGAPIHLETLPHPRLATAGMTAPPIRLLGRR